jgi:hypothetical protein
MRQFWYEPFKNFLLSFLNVSGKILRFLCLAEIDLGRMERIINNFKWDMKGTYSLSSMRFCF